MNLQMFWSMDEEKYNKIFNKCSHEWEVTREPNLSNRPEIDFDYQESTCTKCGEKERRWVYQIPYWKKVGEEETE